MKALYLDFYFASNAFDSTQPEKPMKITGRSTYTTISLNFPKELDFQFDRVTAQVDYGVVFEDITYFEGMSLGTVREMPVQLEDGVLVHVWMNESFKKTEYFVSYKKLQDVAAELGGVITLFVAFAVFILNPMMEVDFISQFITDIFLIE